MEKALSGHCQSDATLAYFAFLFNQLARGLRASELRRIRLTTEAESGRRLPPPSTMQGDELPTRFVGCVRRERRTLARRAGRSMQNGLPGTLRSRRSVSTFPEVVANGRVSP
ncbi:hypothetical protein BRADO2622 [Bradyrhizobium sp. ORS 278]|nr:hypothetical protein BRADO2622 [Bradyrhizobium sp. ORS 278]